MPISPATANRNALLLTEAPDRPESCGRCSCPIGPSDEYVDIVITRVSDPSTVHVIPLTLCIPCAAKVPSHELGKQLGRQLRKVLSNGQPLPARFLPQG